MTAARIRVMAFCQEQECTLCGLRIFFRWMAAQHLEALPVKRLFGLLFAFSPLGFSPCQELQVRRNHREAFPGRLDAAANHLPAFSPRIAEFLLGLVTDLLPMSLRLGERVGSVLLAAQITERSPSSLSLIVTVTLYQIVASRVAGFTQDNERHVWMDSTRHSLPQAFTDTTTGVHSGSVRDSPPVRQGRSDLPRQLWCL
jgi:hypothetical protein